MYTSAPAMAPHAHPTLNIAKHTVSVHRYNARAPSSALTLPKSSREKAAESPSDADADADAIATTTARERGASFETIIDDRVVDASTRVR
jgi:hypothetical protein